MEHDADTIFVVIKLKTLVGVQVPVKEVIQIPYLRKSF